MTENPPIVLVNHTVMDGEVARWYRNAQAAVQNVEAISASRNGVIGGRGIYITPELFNAAWAAHQSLARRQSVRDLATHRREMFSTTLEPIIPGEVMVVPDLNDLEPLAYARPVPESLNSQEDNK